MRVWTKKAIYWKFWENFRKFWKFSFRKLLQMHYFSIFFKKFNKPFVNFLRIWTKKTISWKFWENFRNFWKIFFIKFLIMDYFPYFSNQLTNYVLILFAFGRKTLIFWKVSGPPISWTQYIIIIVQLAFIDSRTPTRDVIWKFS